MVLFCKVSNVVIIRTIYTRPERIITDSAGKYRQECERKAKELAIKNAPPIPPVSKEFKEKFLDCLYSKKYWWKTLPAAVDYTRVLKELSDPKKKGASAPPLSWKLLK